MINVADLPYSPSLGLLVLLQARKGCPPGKGIQLTEEEVTKFEKEYEATSGSGILITTAPEGTSIEHVEAGMRKVEEVKRA
jgi:hypothetical protein